MTAVCARELVRPLYSERGFAPMLFGKVSLCVSFIRDVLALMCLGLLALIALDPQFGLNLHSSMHSSAETLRSLLTPQEKWPVGTKRRGRKKSKRPPVDLMTYTERGPAGLVFAVEARIAHVRSKYQDIEVYKDNFFGNIMVIDGDLMLTELDEVGKPK